MQEQQQQQQQQQELHAKADALAAQLTRTSDAVLALDQVGYMGGSHGWVKGGGHC